MKAVAVAGGVLTTAGLAEALASIAGADTTPAARARLAAADHEQGRKR